MRPSSQPQEDRGSLIHSVTLSVITILNAVPDHMSGLVVVVVKEAVFGSVSYVDTLGRAAF